MKMKCDTYSWRVVQLPPLTKKQKEACEKQKEAYYLQVEQDRLERQRGLSELFRKHGNDLIN